MTHSTEKLAILFADICGSTALYDQLGDQVAQRLMSSCIATMSAVVKARSGLVVKTIGDEVLCVFPSAHAAMLAACDMQLALQKARFDGGRQMHIRVGFHYGNVIREGGDVFGDTVNVAARIAAQARANQIMTSQAVVEALPDALRASTHRLMAAEFKGKDSGFDIYFVTWAEEADGATQIRPPSEATIIAPETASELTLTYGGKVVTVNQERKKIIFGRGEGCDIVIASSLTSRQHAGIELRFGKFFIVDQSANGTYVRGKDGHVSHITRQEMVLQGTGLISPGQSYAENPSELIRFVVT